LSAEGFYWFLVSGLLSQSFFLDFKSVCFALGFYCVPGSD
jgi:hypothetical protein